jgi:hypothetical protein
MAPPNREEDLNLPATVTSGSEVWNDVSCKVWLPRKHGERPIIFLYPTGPYAHLLGQAPPPYRLRAELTQLNGTKVTVCADEVWFDDARTRSLGAARDETVIQATPIDLRVTRRRDAETRTSPVAARTLYHLTRCPPIRAASLLQASYTGEVKLRERWTFDFVLTPATTLTFERIYKHEQRDDEQIQWTELIARKNHDLPAEALETIDQETLGQLDDLLALVAVASHYRSACVSVHTTTDDLDQFSVYRGNITIPSRDQEADPVDAPIDRSEFDPFLRAAYDAFVATGPHELLRHALYLVGSQVERTLESEFTALYAALETILLWYRQSHLIERIVEDDTVWDTLKRDTRAYLKAHPLLAGNSSEQKQRREWIAGKLGELRRVPFQAAFRRFCKDYDVHLDDLWPLFNTDKDDVSLTEIRNRIVHGSVFDRQHSQALIGAKQHMRWVVERVLIAVLRWPLDRTHLTPAYLADTMTAVAELATDRATLRRPATGDTVARAAEGDAATE